eukprot:TRINITY_DN1245_c0_g1_i13.p1 TRINITY_DN1245_c0_g1~~TRINITY_DN1245_c0_g1_i13.p1  ORF type:complete len:430 (-),score=110.38 TRINITY_DN1245_c0_g1_i13:319-1563(-)
MLRSLVGSEMCIRDSINAEYGEKMSGHMGWLLPLLALLARGVDATRVGVSVIVKDEMVVLPAMLDSLRGEVDAFMICDTGSSDGTPEFARQYLEKHGLRGQVVSHLWQDFGHNRNLCMASLQEQWPDMEYILCPDADFVFKSTGPWKDSLRADSVAIMLEFDAAFFRSVRLVATSHRDCSWKGTVHEYLTCTNGTRGRVEYLSATVKNTNDTPSRRLQKSSKYYLLLRDHLAEHPKDPRTLFYLGQTHEEMGNYQEAIRYYKQRVELQSGFREEIFYSLYSIGVCKQKAGAKIEEYAVDLIAAYEKDPARIEPIYMLVRAYRLAGRYQMGLLYGASVLGTELPHRSLWVRDDIYEWRLADEMSLCYHKAGQSQRSVELTSRLLEQAKMDHGTKQRLLENMKWYRLSAAEEARQI